MTTQSNPTQSNPGTVYLVGAGPGDPDLLTVKAARLLGEAKAVVYDALVSPRILDLVDPEAELHFVGKRKGKHFAEQEDINEVLVELAGRHEVVVRIKGGDPYLFGRGAEEQEHLVDAGVPAEVVPGVTSAIAVPAYAGIPLTHRDFAAMATIATGHRKKGAEDRPVDWELIGKTDATISVLMGVKRLDEVTSGLMAGGRPPETGAALIEWGTTPRQRVLTATLATLADSAAEAGFEPPSVLVVGDVVSLHERLDWFGARPLLGRRILVARDRAGRDPVSEGLGRLGAEVIAVPSLGWQDAQGGEPATARIDVGLDGLCVLSEAGFDALEEHVGSHRLRDALAPGAPVLCVSEAVAARLGDAGLEARICDPSGPEGLISAVAALPIRESGR